MVIQRPYDVNEDERVANNVLFPELTLQSTIGFGTRSVLDSSAKRTMPSLYDLGVGTHTWRRQIAEVGLKQMDVLVMMALLL